MTQMEIGEVIRNKRVELNMTQQQLAKAIGCEHKQYIPKIEKGKTNITTDRLLKICKALNLKIEIQ